MPTSKAPFTFLSTDATEEDEEVMISWLPAAKASEELLALFRAPD